MSIILAIGVGLMIFGGIMFLILCGKCNFTVHRASTMLQVWSVIFLMMFAVGATMLTYAELERPRHSERDQHQHPLND